MEFDVVIVRYGEIGIKSEQVRRKFEALLMGNIRAMLDSKGVAYEDVIKERGRIFVVTKDPKAPRVVGNVFGVVSTSPAVRAGPTIEEAAAVAAAFGKELIKDGQSFGIMGRRSGNQPFTSQDIGRQCGDAVYNAVAERHPKVDLKNPDHSIHVEIRDTHSYIFTDIVKGVGGMPLGSQGKMVAMESGGIDSPIAAWLMMKRGCEIVPVFFHNAPYFDDTTMNRALSTLKELNKWCPGHEMKVYVMPHGKNLRTFLEKGNQKYTCVFCKHLMYKVSRAIAEKEGAHGIVTGSSMGQVASQTSNNMLAEIYDVDFPINHPLIGLDKEEIIEISKRIGMFGISIQKAMGCKAVPKHPSIHGHLEEVIKMEKEQFDFGELVKYEVDNAKIVEI
ncbi:MAG TPA: tRNA uracil 4-sulfurtransferase ThiI [Methanocella sp.]|uniref:tRNA uracil 4-sulfurtransferase ThiI n=1 Tax=Methanocella sp. TaxID=2052833 RepID=UPI002C4EC5C3|nr:tRNA uracil 4-sulfurtransferase ThiI [Methanocella sp.]HTY90915.1 tRNA uracil 4-sulfurtransferase ThiI [Methanocella sp.]